MPQQPQHPCLTPGCPKLTLQGYCDAHKAQWSRASASKRGYGRKWQHFRLAYLAKHPLCIDCGQKGKVMLAEHIHHKVKLIMAPGMKYTASNLMGLCKPCHAVRTARGE